VAHGEFVVRGGPGARLEQVGFVLVSVGFQVCLNGAPILLEWRVGHEVVGDFVIASTYFRIPSLLVAGVLTHALVELSHGWGQRDQDRFVRTRRTGLLQVLVLGACGSAGLAVVSPIALRLYAGSTLELSWAVFLALPLSTVAAVIASMAGQPVLAAGRTLAAGLSWLVGAAVTTAFLLSASGVGAMIGTGLVAGPLVALALLLVANRGLREALAPTAPNPRTLSGTRDTPSASRIDRE
jgi:O-antigen/teichoic acid export membrane protein